MERVEQVKTKMLFGSARTSCGKIRVKLPKSSSSSTIERVEQVKTKI